MTDAIPLISKFRDRVDWDLACLLAGNFPIFCYNGLVPAQVLFLSCGLISLGLIFAMIGAIQLRIPLQSLRWKSTEGEITRANSSDASKDAVHTGIRYRYSVRGQLYSGSRVSFHSDILSGLIPQQKSPAGVEHYSRGAPVKVYYDPLQPDRSVLEPGAGLASYLPLAAGGLFFITGMIFGLLAFV